jgi:hypothetical protein
MENHSKPWTPELEEVLREGVIAGTSLSAIAKRLGRSESAIKSRAYTLRLILRAPWNETSRGCEVGLKARENEPAEYT